jgi:hypothetical protein
MRRPKIVQLFRLFLQHWTVPETRGLPIPFDFGERGCKSPAPPMFAANRLNGLARTARRAFTGPRSILDLLAGADVDEARLSAPRVASTIAAGLPFAAHPTPRYATLETDPISQTLIDHRGRRRRRQPILSPSLNGAIVFGPRRRAGARRRAGTPAGARRVEDPETSWPLDPSAR